MLPPKCLFSQNILVPALLSNGKGPPNLSIDQTVCEASVHFPSMKHVPFKTNVSVYQIL